MDKRKRREARFLLLITFIVLVCCGCGNGRGKNTAVQSETREEQLDEDDNRDSPEEGEPAKKETNSMAGENETGEPVTFTVEIDTSRSTDSEYISDMIVTLHDGTVIEMEYGADLNKAPYGQSAEAHTGDLNEDGQEEIVVALRVVGSTFEATNVCVYEIEGKELVEVFQDQNISDFDSRFVSCVSAGVEDGYLVLTGYTELKKETDELRLKWENGEWIKVSADAAASDTTDTATQLYVTQHIEYVDSDSYDKEIIPGYGPNLLEVFQYTKEDTDVLKYDVIKLVNDAIQLDFEVDDVGIYKQILGQLMLCEQGLTGAQELFEDNIAQQAVAVLREVLENDAIRASLPDTILPLLEKKLSDMEAKAEWSKSFEENFFSVLDLLDENLESESIKTALSEAPFLAGIGLDVASESYSSAKDIVEYVIYGSAYMNTSDEFIHTLRMLFKETYEETWGKYEEVGVLESQWNTRSLQVALIEFTDEMEAYKDDGAKAVAEYAVSVTKNAASDVAQNIVKEISAECVEQYAKTLIPLIPGLKEAYIVTKVLSVGLSVDVMLREVLTNIDERSYSANMLVKYYCMSDLLDEVVSQCAWDLKQEGSYKWAARFDNAVNVYKSANILAADYAIAYLNGCIEDKSTVFSVYERSWYSTAISQVAAEKLFYQNIRCHTVELED